MIPTVPQKLRARKLFSLKQKFPISQLRIFQKKYKKQLRCKKRLKLLSSSLSQSLRKNNQSILQLTIAAVPVVQATVTLTPATIAPTTTLLTTPATLAIIPHHLAPLPIQTLIRTTTTTTTPATLIPVPVHPTPITPTVRLTSMTSRTSKSQRVTLTSTLPTNLQMSLLRTMISGTTRII